MRAREFTINVPIKIVINGDGDPDISAGNTPQDDDELATNFAPPLQQKLELMKHAAGKEGKIIDQITADDDNEAS
jgi:hypothetical protein